MTDDEKPKPQMPKAIFTLTFHEDLKEEDALDLHVAINALGAIAGRRDGGIKIVASKPDGGEVTVPILIPMQQPPKDAN